MSETTTDRLAEIEGQAADYTPPEGWRLLQEDEVIEAGDRWVRPADKQAFYALRIGTAVSNGTFIRRIAEPQPEPEPESDRIITPDDVAAEALAGAWDQTQAEQQIAELQAQVKFLKNREVTLGTRLEEEKAVTTKRLETIQELRSEVSHVQRLWGESRRRVEELETLMADLRAVNAATEKAVNSEARNRADLQHRLDTVAAEWALQAGQISGLQQQLEAVKAELVQVSKDRQALQIELDAYELRSHNVSDRFEEGWDKGTAQAVETIAEWIEPIKASMDAADNQDELARAGFFAIDTIRHLPVIMRTLTMLTDED